jgi:hypothetical protein
VLGGEEFDVGCAAAVKLGEERFEPVRLLVVDGDGKRAGHGRLVQDKTSVGRVRMQMCGIRGF